MEGLIDHDSQIFSLKYLKLCLFFIPNLIKLKLSFMFLMVQLQFLLYIIIKMALIIFLFDNFMIALFVYTV